MVKQYRDIVSWLIPGTPGTVDPETGDPVPGTPGETVEAQGRYENFRSSNRVEWEGPDGETILQKGTIYIKKGQPCPDRFERVTVTSPEFEEVFSGIALNVYQGQLNYTIAV